MKKLFSLLLLCSFTILLTAEDGYKLWLRYYKITDNKFLQQCRNKISGIHINGNNATMKAAREELINGLEGLLDKKISFTSFSSTIPDNSVLAGSLYSSSQIRSLKK
jgi:alpha-glucuronidase